MVCAAGMITKHEGTLNRYYVDFMTGYDSAAIRECTMVRPRRHPRACFLRSCIPPHGCQGMSLSPTEQKIVEGFMETIFQMSEGTFGGRGAVAPARCSVRHGAHRLWDAWQGGARTCGAFALTGFASRPPWPGRTRPTGSRSTSRWPPS
jgi:hypothetical protein